jgi:hypothetical protein
VVAHDAARFRKRRAHQALERIDGVVNGLDRRANPSFVFFGFVRIERFQGVIKGDATWLFPQVKPDKTQSTTPFLQRWIPRPIVSAPPQHGGEEEARVGTHGCGEKSVNIGEHSGLLRNS